jgi:hypothetical protein
LRAIQLRHGEIPSKLKSSQAVAPSGDLDGHGVRESQD